MMSNSDRSEPIFRFIPLADYECPSEPPAEQLRTGLLAFWQRIRRGATTLTSAQEEDADTTDEQEIQQEVDTLAPWPDWTDLGVDALDNRLETWRAAEDDAAGCRVVVAPPHSRVETMVARWADRHGYRVLALPTYSQILREPEQWLEQLPRESGARFVLVALERCYLRHYNGLNLVRSLIQRLWQEGLPCVLGCDSWAWAYLNLACHAGILDPNPLTLAPLEAETISRWLASSVYGDESRALPHIYRRTDSGVRVFPIHHARHGREDNGREDNGGEDDGEDSRKKEGTDEADDEVTSEFLVHVAAHSRGIAGVVWALWRKSLAISDRHTIHTRAQDAADRDGDATVWVKKWETLEVPAIPSELGDTSAFVLHAVLLHGGLGFEELHYLIPGSQVQLANDLNLLQRAQILEQHKERFTVSPLAYPTVRTFLAGESFLTDGI